MILYGVSFYSVNIRINGSKAEEKNPQKGDPLVFHCTVLCMVIEYPPWMKANINISFIVLYSEKAALCSWRKNYDNNSP